MAGAIGLAPGRREPAIGEISRFADRRAATGRRIRECPRTAPAASLRSRLRQRAVPPRVSSPGATRGSRATASGALLAGAGSRIGESRPLRPARACPRLARAEARPPPPPLSLIPIRLALPMTALRDPTPSAAAMALALFPSRASLLRSSTASAVHSIRKAPIADAAALNRAGMVCRKDILFLDRDTGRRNGRRPVLSEKFPIFSAS